jgi:hypothetical protein
MNSAYPQHNDAMVRSSRVTSCNSKLSDRKLLIVAELINRKIGIVHAVAGVVSDYVGVLNHFLEPAESSFPPASQARSIQR